MNALILFAKAPVPGRVKTRLQPALSGEQSSRLYEAFVRDSLASARLCEGVEVSVAYAPLPRRPDVSWLESPPSWFPQADGDLGERLTDAFARAFKAGAAKVVAIGSDCPDLEPAILRRAFEQLDEAEVVLGPALDGGYYLVGLRSAMPHLFTKMEWSTRDVLARTLNRLRLRGETYRLLEPRQDVDTVADLYSLHRRLCSGESSAPRTLAALRGLSSWDRLVERFANQAATGDNDA